MNTDGKPKLSDPPDPNLVLAMSRDTGVSAELIDRWLLGERVAEPVRRVLLESLWRPIEENAARLVRCAQTSAPVVAAKEKLYCQLSLFAASPHEYAERMSICPCLEK